MPDGSNVNADPLLEAIMQSVLDAIIAVDARGVVVAWNDIATRTFGWTATEAVGRALGQLIVPGQYRASHQAGMLRYQQTGEARVVNRRIEISAIDKSGREFPVELSIIPTPENDQAAFIGFIRDISDRRAAQDRLSVSEESLRLTTEAAEIGTWDLDLLTNQLTWTDRTKAMFGISPDVPCSMDDFYNGLHPEDRDATGIAFARALDPALRAGYDVEYRTIGKEDARIRWVAAKGRGLFDESGRCIRAVGTAIDITARKLADARHAFMLKLSDVLRGSETQAALNEVCALMGSYFGVTRTGYGQLDPIEDIFDYSICWTDGSVPPLLGRFPAAAFGKKIVERLGAGETVVVENLFADAVSDEAQTRQTATSVDTRAILVVPFVRAGRLRTIVYLNDRKARQWTQDQVEFMQEVAERTRQVIERGEAEAALRALNASLEARVEERTSALRSTEEALRQSQKMEAIGQLTGGIAHDFNNLLAAISGSVEVIKRLVAAGRTTEIDRFVTAALTSTHRAAALTHRLLAFSRMQSLDRQPLDVNRLVLELVELLHRTLGETIELETTLPPELWPAFTDANQLESAVLNLVINARDAMPGGGRLSIKTANASLNPAYAAAHADVTAGDYVTLSVSDTGTGMSAETIARAFEPFFTTKPIGQGTGLGLSMIYGFAKQSGGHVRIDSTLGLGTTVTLYLPRASGPAGRVETRTASEALPTGQGESVLIVEDETIVRETIVEVLKELGYRYLEAADARTAIPILSSDYQIDLLVTDVGLPHMNGRQLAEIARARRPHLKVLFITGYAEKAADRGGFLGPDMEMLTKPFALDTLAMKLRSMLGN
ncbi:MAG: PAS domain S-box protein [Gammaproteobacteria bacterium]